MATSSTKIHFNIYKESLLDIVKLVSSLHNQGYYNIQTRFDGTFSNDIYDYLISQNVKVINNNRRLKKAYMGGLDTECYLYNCNNKYLIKVDPDTVVTGLLPDIPDNSIGCNYNQEKYHIYGGCILFTKQAINNILESKLLLSDKYKQEFYNYRNHKLKEDLSCQDLILYDVITTLNINMKSLDDCIFCRNERDSYIPYNIEQYSFIHL